ncbi:MAG: TolC family protein [Bryobacteraceae bacterium]
MQRVVVLAAAGAFAAVVPVWAQKPTPLSGLLAEAARNNPDIAAARHAWRAATHVRKQVTTLPNPKFTVQDFSVGGAKPWSGFNTSNFAYFGFGVSQKLPFPGKLRLKGEAADRAAGVRHAEIGATQASVADEIKADYFRLAYLQRMIALLQDSRLTLSQLAKSELYRYQTGAGDQADVLKAQLERTKLVRDLTVQHEEEAQTEADLKRLLRRPQESADIVTEPLTASKLRYSSRELLAFARKQNPEVNVEESTVRKGDADVRSAERSGKPDFSIGYMFERTGDRFPAYYMLTFNVIFQRRQRTRAAVEEAEELATSSRYRLEAQIQQQQAQVRKQYAAAIGTAEQAKEYRQGLIPQAEATYKAILAEYESNQRQLDWVLTSFNNLLEMKREYARTLFDHQTAIASLETLTGVKLR